MHRRIALAISVLALAGCGRTQTPDTPPSPADAATVAEAPAPATIAAVPGNPAIAEGPAPMQPAPMPDGSYAHYRCEDGSEVSVHFNGIAATVAWPDGRTTQLSQSKTVAEGQPQVYSDRSVRIERDAEGLHLRIGAEAEKLCTETEASA
jgi:hypothetical protein